VKTWVIKKKVETKYRLANTRNQKTKPNLLKAFCVTLFIAHVALIILGFLPYIGRQHFKSYSCAKIAENNDSNHSLVRQIYF